MSDLTAEMCLSGNRHQELTPGPSTGYCLGGNHLEARIRDGSWLSLRSGNHSTLGGGGEDYLTITQQQKVVHQPSDGKEQKQDEPQEENKPLPTTNDSP